MTVEEGCAACHFDGPVQTDSEALILKGLPERLVPGRRYDLTVELTDSPMDKAGFMIFFHQTSGPVGEAASNVDGVETQGAKARSKLEGTTPQAPGSAQWHLRWLAPESIEGPVRVTLWSNAANGDDSPFGDKIHRRIFLAQPKQ